MSDIKTILKNIGYRLSDDGRFWRAKPIYRDSGNSTSLRIAKDSGNFVDFSAGKKGSFEELVQISLNLKDFEEAKVWLDNKEFTRSVYEEKPKIEVSLSWKRDILSNFLNDQSYWESKGISSKTASLFEGGLFNEWKMDNRYVFPIFDNRNRIVGFSGRDLTNKSKIKWKHIGSKTKWVWPAHLNRKIIEETKEVILVESPGCVLKLWEAGIKNSLCLFGTKLPDSIICFLAGVQPNKVIVATNNEPDNNNIGNIAAEKIKDRLSHFINMDKIKIILPTKKDFGEMEINEILDWYKLS